MTPPTIDQRGLEAALREAHEKMRVGVVEYNIHDRVLVESAVERAITAYLSAASPEHGVVKVKPLKWQHFSALGKSPEQWFANDTVFGGQSFTVTFEADHELPWVARPFPPGPSNYATPDEAKSALDTVRESRILSALSSSAGQTLESGWKAVPVEPTEAMMQAGEDAFVAHFAYVPPNPWDAIGDIFRTMLAASPSDRDAGITSDEPVAWQIFTGEEGDGWVTETERWHAEQAATEGARVVPLYHRPTVDTRGAGLEEAAKPIAYRASTYGDPELWGYGATEAAACSRIPGMSNEDVAGSIDALYVEPPKLDAPMTRAFAAASSAVAVSDGLSSYRIEIRFPDLRLMQAAHSALVTSVAAIRALKGPRP